MDADVIIIGHGLAGAALAWHLHWRGCRVKVIDRDEPLTSSKVAAGIVTPISGKRVARSWRVDDFLPAARDFYARTEAELGAAFYRHTPYVRMLLTEDERRRWQEKRVLAEFQELLTHPQPQPVLDAALFHAPEEGLEMKSAWLDVRGWLAASQARLQQRGEWMAGEVEAGDVVCTADGVSLCGLTARHPGLLPGLGSGAESVFPVAKVEEREGRDIAVPRP